MGFSTATDKFRCSSSKNVGNDARFEIVSTNTISAGNWYHVVCAWDGTMTTNGVKLYVNGQLEAQGTADAADSTTYSSNFGIGIDYPILNNGLVDEVKVYNYALTASEVGSDYNRGSAQVLGSLGDKTIYEKNSSNQLYCYSVCIVMCIAC